MNRLMAMLLIGMMFTSMGCSTHQERTWGYVQPLQQQTTYNPYGGTPQYNGNVPYNSNYNVGNLPPGAGTSYNGIPTNNGMVANGNGGYRYEHNSEGWSMQEIYPAIGLALGATSLIWDMARPRYHHRHHRW